MDFQPISTIKIKLKTNSKEKLFWYATRNCYVGEDFYFHHKPWNLFNFRYSSWDDRAMVKAIKEWDPFQNEHT